MNNEERELISRFVARVGGGAQAQQGGAFGSFGQQQAPALPPVDPEADRFIADNFQRYPEARYRVTQMAVVQEAALAQAQNRIRQLEFQLQQAQSQLAQAQQQRGNAGGGLFGGLFSGGARQQQASAPPPGWGAQAPQMPPQPQYGYPPGYQQGMFQRGGSGFLGSALTTAAGVAGGMMAADALEGLFSEHHHDGGWGQDGGFGGGETIINNNYGDAGQDPFAGSGTDAGGGFSDSDFGGGGFGGNDFDDSF
nr:DUF2076 domain-containing protein [uncultured Neokomagataea sp.]